MTEHLASTPVTGLRLVVRAGTLALALLCAGLPSLAQRAAGAPDSPDRRAPAAGRETRDVQSAEAFAARLRALFPETHIDAVKATETPGLFEVVMGPNIAYIDASGRYWTFGHRYDMVERRDLTAPRLAAAGRVDTAGLPLDAALKTVRGSGRRVLHVFADPNCGYCRQFEAALAQLDDLTVYTYLLPILSPDSTARAASIWCAPDRAQAWRAWMLDGVEPPARRDCAAPTDRVLAAARRLRIDATPTLIAADGRKAAGAMPAGELSAWLDAGAAAEVAAVRRTSVPAAPAPN